MNFFSGSMRWGIKCAGTLVAPGGSRGKLLILCYHRILREADPLIAGCTDAATFETHMEIVAKLFSPLPMSEAVRRLRNGTLPARAVGVTFDDGYADNLEVALPILRKYSVPATVFVAVGFVDGGRMWTDTILESVRRAPGDRLDLSDFGLPSFPIGTAGERRNAALTTILHLRRMPFEKRAAYVEGIADRIGADLPDDLMLTSEQLATLHSSGIEIGAHTITHPILSRLSAECAEEEIHGSRRELQQRIGAEVVGFAYPNGAPGVDYDRTHVDAVDRAGFAYAVTTSLGCASRTASHLQLPRLVPWDSEPMRFAGRLVKEYAGGNGQAV